MEPTEALEAARQVMEEVMEATTAWVEATTATTWDTWLASTDAEPCFPIITMATVLFLVCQALDLLVFLVKAVLLATFLATLLHAYNRQEGAEDAEPCFAVITMATVLFLICQAMDLLVFLVKSVLLTALLATSLHACNRRQEGLPTSEQ